MTQWYSHKFNGPGLSYELGISVHHQQCAWIRGPYKAAMHNLTIYRSPNELTKSKVLAGKKVIANTIYADPTCSSIHNHLDTPEVKRFKKRAQACHENFNGQHLKIYSVTISGKFRQGHEKHKSVFEAV